MLKLIIYSWFLCFSSLAQIDPIFELEAPQIDIRFNSSRVHITSAPRPYRQKILQGHKKFLGYTL